MSIAPAHLIWPATFEVIGPLAFLVVAVTLVVQAPVLRFALRTRWDDAFGGVFLAHTLVLLGLVVVGIPFTSAFAEGTVLDVSGDAWWAPLWARLRWTALTLPALLWPAGREALAWPNSGTLPLVASAGVSVLTQVLVVRSTCDLRWTLRNLGTLIALALVTTGALVLLVRWPAGAVEAGAEIPVEG